MFWGFSPLLCKILHQASFPVALGRYNQFFCLTPRAKPNWWSTYDFRDIYLLGDSGEVAIGLGGGLCTVFALGMMIPSTKAAFGSDPGHLARLAAGPSALATPLVGMTLGCVVTISLAFEALLGCMVTMEPFTHMRLADPYQILSNESIALGVLSLKRSLTSLLRYFTIKSRSAATVPSSSLEGLPSWLSVSFLDTVPSEMIDRVVLATRLLEFQPARAEQTTSWPMPLKLLMTLRKRALGTCF